MHIREKITERIFQILLLNQILLSFFFSDKKNSKIFNNCRNVDYKITLRVVSKQDDFDGAGEKRLVEDLFVE